MRMYCNVAPAAAAPCCAGASSPRRVHWPLRRAARPPPAAVHTRGPTCGVSCGFEKTAVINIRAYLHDRASAAGTRARETNMIPPGGVRGTSCGAASRDPLLSLVPLASRERRVEVVLA